MDPLGTVLGVWAHPDDETYLSGALMARAAGAGSRVVCVTATRGEQGSPDETRWPPGPALAEVRTREMERALAELGAIEHHWLDYPDGGCADVDQGEAVGRVRAVVEEVRPDTVLTFGPDGMTGHADHRAVSRWASDAVAQAGLGSARVHHATNPPAWLSRFRTALDALGVYMGAEPPCTAPEDLSVYLLAEGALLDRKERAIRRQQSQVQPLVDALGPSLFRAMLVQEAYREAR
ncbi:MAG: PIG-L deacetylase family protein [Actinomycetes bacterium]